MKNTLVFIFVALSFFAKAQSFTSVAVSDSIESILITHVEDSILSSEYVVVNIHEAFYYTDENIYVSLGSIPGSYVMAVSHEVVPLVVKPTTGDCTRAWTVFEIVNWLKGNVGDAYEEYSTSGSGTITAVITIDSETYTGTGSNVVNAVGDAFFEFLKSAEFLVLLIN